MAVKGAATDGLKRVLRTFGNQFGNSLYDKDSEDNRALKSGAKAPRTRVTTVEKPALPPAKPINCEEEVKDGLCGKVLQSYRRRDNSTATAEDMAKAGRDRFGKALCLQHLKVRMDAAEAAKNGASA